jgi:hypothetical protein
MRDIILLGISVDPLSNGSYLTIIRYINRKGAQDEVNRVDLFLQGSEEFISAFRIKHKL